MATTTLEDEVIAINSIYGNTTLSPIAANPTLYSIRFPTRPLITLRIQFPDDYPNAPPIVLGTETSINEGTKKGEGKRLAQIVTEVLARVYQPGEPCIFDLIEEVSELLGPQEQEVQQAPGHDTVEDISQDLDRDDADGIVTKSGDLIDGDPPHWVLSSPVTEKKSVFIARAAAVSSPGQAKLFLTHLLATDRKVAKATHNITAWRIRSSDHPEVLFQDCDDDGETAAGGRVLHLMQLMDAWGVMVVVSRWYGGVHLGPDRFRIINQVARDALLKGGFLKDGERTDGPPGKSKRKK